jgi:hypothetical protein
MKMQKEHILFFAFEDWWLADFESYHSGQPGKAIFPGIGGYGTVGDLKTGFYKNGN